MSEEFTALGGHNLTQRGHALLARRGHAIASRALLRTTIVQGSAQASESRRRAGIEVVGGVYFGDNLLDSLCRCSLCIWL